MEDNRIYDAAVTGDVQSLLDLLQNDPLILDGVSFTCSKRTPLHIATIRKHAPFVREIVQSNPLLAAELDFHQSSSLHIASAKGYTEIVKDLVSAAPGMCLARDCQGRNPLHLAAINGHVTVFNELMMTTTSSVADWETVDGGTVQRNPLPDAELDSDQSSRLHIASAKDYIEIVKASIREKVDRGQTVLHLCVKHKQLEVMKIIMKEVNDYEFVNAKNEDGDTILHLAVRCKNWEAVRHLTKSTRIDVNAVNANGYSALDILKLTPTVSTDTNYLSIKNCLQTSTYNFINRQKLEIKLLNHDSIMVVEILIATMSFQVGVTPPGGVWQDNATDNSHQAGEAVMAHFRPKIYRFFLIANIISFTSSISMIMILIIGLPLGIKRITFSLMVFMWFSVTSTFAVYGASIREVTPKKDMETVRYFMDGWFLVWYSLTIIPLVIPLVNMIRSVNLFVRKPGTTTTPRRSTDSVNDNQGV